MRTLLWGILLLLFFLHLVIRVAAFPPQYTLPLDGEYWTERYQKSQWVVPGSKTSIGDDGLYAYHGWALIQGSDPSFVNPEVPPLGKYLIGLTILMFGNNNLFGLYTGLFALCALYLLNTALFKDRLLAFLPVFLFSFEPVFYGQLQASYLDSLHLMFLCLAMFFFLKKRFILSSIMIGLFASVKFTLLLFPVAAVFFCFLLFTRQRKEIKQFLFSLIAIPVVLLLSYTRFFLLGHTPFDFLRLQKFILNFYETGAKAPFPGMVFPMIFLNKWYTWWSSVIPVQEWRLSWPVVFVGGIAAVFMSKRLNTSPMFVISLWCLAYLLFLCITPVWPRYLLLLLPFLYNLTIWVLSESIGRKYFSRSSS